MSLNGALQVGRSALTASQAALQVAGNNMANAATVGFHRQSVHLAPARGQSIGRGFTVGQGVQLSSIRREVDTALQARYRDSISEEHAFQIDQQFLTAMETIQNELSDNDLSSVLSEFFNSFSELANNPTDNAVRAVVIQQGEALAGRIADIRNDYNTLREQIDRQVGSTTRQANDLLDQIAMLNQQISTSERAPGQASALRDQRDLAIDELSELMEVTVIEQSSGSTDILINSIPVVLASENRGVEMRTRTVGDEVEISLRVAADGTDLDVTTGELGGLLRQRDEVVQPAVDAINTFAGELIHEVNRVHSQGQGLKGFETLAGTYSIVDQTANLNSGDSGLPFRIENGSFFVHMTHQASGETTAYRIDVDGDAMSMDDLLAQINTVVDVPNLTASLNFKQQLELTAAAGYEFSFSDDSSGALASLGVNTFFDGQNATTVTVNQTLLDDPTLLAAGADHIVGSNTTAVALANLQDNSIDALGGRSLREFWQNSVNDLAVQAASANRSVDSAQLVRESLDAQQQAVSGVSLDEESINLLTYQRQYQAAARFISVIDETIQTLLSIV